MNIIAMIESRMTEQSGEICTCTIPGRDDKRNIIAGGEVTGMRLFQRPRM
jgi:hypothetical protein